MCYNCGMMNTEDIVKMRVGTRVKYVGRSIQVAEHGELGTIIGSASVAQRYGSQAGTTVTMFEAAWDAAASSYCWPSELEVVDDDDSNALFAERATAARVAAVMWDASVGPGATLGDWTHDLDGRGAIVSERVR